MTNSPRVRLKTLARLINEQLPKFEAKIVEGQYTIEREWPGHRAVLSRRTVRGTSLQVYPNTGPMAARFRPIFECNLAAWYERTDKAVRWFIEQGGKLPKAKRKAHD